MPTSGNATAWSALTGCRVTTAPSWTAGASSFSRGRADGYPWDERNVSEIVVRTALATPLSGSWS